jgi:RNA polymerase sigma-70 factor (ECF subfamily)
MLLLKSTCADFDVASPASPIAEDPNTTAGQAAVDLSNFFDIQLEAEIPYLRRMVRCWQRNATDADDLVQDTLMRAVVSAHQWRPGSSLRAWLLTIMRNQFLEGASRARRSRAAIELIDASAASASDNAEVRLVLRDVVRAIRRLPERQRSALLLAGIEEKSYADAASLMGLTPDAVRCHLARARDRLRSAVHRAEEPNWLHRTAAASGSY